MTRSSSAYWPKVINDETAVAEIGVKDGETTMLLARHLDNKGKIFAFDYHDRAERAAERCRKEGLYNVEPVGNSYKLFDSYNWSLMSLIKKRDREVFDYVYFDGAHTWHHDALAAILCMRLLKVGGYIDVDDHDHRYLTSQNAAPGLPVQHRGQDRPRTESSYTDEQVAERQVQLVIDLIIKDDERFKEVVVNKVFRKVSR